MVMVNFLIQHSAGHGCQERQIAPGSVFTSVAILRYSFFVIERQNRDLGVIKENWPIT